MRSLALQVQQSFGRDPFAGDLYIFRGRRGDLCKIIWHDGVGMSLYAKRLERGKYIWPSAVDGVIAISPSQMACMLEAIDWRNPRRIDGVELTAFDERSDHRPVVAALIGAGEKGILTVMHTFP